MSIKKILFLVFAIACIHFTAFGQGENTISVKTTHLKLNRCSTFVIPIPLSSIMPPFKPHA